MSRSKILSSIKKHINTKVERESFSYEKVDNMHDGMKKVQIDEFWIFLSGPSKTADIEQSLVIGTHGAKRLGVYFNNSTFAYAKAKLFA